MTKNKYAFCVSIKYKCDRRKQLNWSGKRRLIFIVCLFRKLFSRPKLFNRSSLDSLVFYLHSFKEFLYLMFKNLWSSLINTNTMYKNVVGCLAKLEAERVTSVVKHRIKMQTNNLLHVFDDYNNSCYWLSQHWHLFMITILMNNTCLLTQDKKI